MLKRPPPLFPRRSHLVVVAVVSGAGAFLCDATTALALAHCACIINHFSNTINPAQLSTTAFRMHCAADQKRAMRNRQPVCRCTHALACACMNLCTPAHNHVASYLYGYLSSHTSHIRIASQVRVHALHPTVCEHLAPNRTEHI